MVRNNCSYATILQNMYDFVSRQIENKRMPATWGHRAESIPPNKTVLFFGNSHTRQLALNLACQMAHAQDVKVHRFDANMIDHDMAARFGKWR